MCYTPNTTKVDGGVQLYLNLETSVVGYVAVEIRDHDSGRPVAGYELEAADRLKGAAVSAVASWQGGRLASLSALAGKKVSLHVAMADAKLYSVRMGCAAAV